MTLPPYPASPFPAQPTAIVTGAASVRGIGRATAHRLARDGWAVAIFDLDDAACRAIAEEVAREHDVPTLGIGVDITREDDVEEAVSRVVGSLPQLVGLVNNAGISSPVPFLDVTSAEWRRVFDVNVSGTFHVTRAAVRVMADNRLGRIVNVASASAERGGGVYGRAAYSGSKAALLGWPARWLGSWGPTG